MHSDSEAEGYINSQYATLNRQGVVGARPARLLGKDEEARFALRAVLGSLDAGLSLDAIEAACRTIRSHIGE